MHGARLVESRGETPAIGRRERIVRAEAVEQRDGDLAQPFALRGIGSWHGVDDEGEGALDIVCIEKRNDLWELARSTELLDERVGSWRREQLVEEEVDAPGASVHP